jgi:hypothetical protein
MRSRQRLACWSLGALTLLPLAYAAAQSPRRTTVGRLLGGPVDTIAVQESDGGRIGSTGAWLQLVRVDSGYSGTLQLHSWKAGLTSGSNTVLVYKGRTVRHGERRYRAPPKRDRKGQVRPPWPDVDMNTPLMKAHEMLRPYLQPERLIAFDRACRAE